jgi:hypothetical protein
MPKRFNLGSVTGRPGTDPCQFNVPHELLVTADHRVCVMDRENHRWQVFTTDGEFISLQEQVSDPDRVAFDTDGTFYIAGGAWMDTDSSLYTAEASRNSRLQKFVRV